MIEKRIILGETETKLILKESKESSNNERKITENKIEEEVIISLFSPPNRESIR